MPTGKNGRADVDFGFTRVANQLLDKIISADLKKREILVLLATIRETYGYHRTEAEISLTRYAIATGLRPAHLSSAISELERRKILLPKREGVTAQIRGINRNLWEWEGFQNRNPDGASQNSKRGVPETGKNLLPKQEHSIKKIKEKVKDTSRPSAGKIRAKVGSKKFELNPSVAERFLRFWDAFGYKTGRAEAAGEWALLDAEHDPIPSELFDRIIQAATITAEERPAMIDKGRTPKMAQGWLSSERYLDEYYDRAITMRTKKTITKKEDPEKERLDNSIAYIESMRGMVKGIPEREQGEDLKQWASRAEKFIVHAITKGETK